MIASDNEEIISFWILVRRKYNKMKTIIYRNISVRSKTDNKNKKQLQGLCIKERGTACKRKLY